MRLLISLIFIMSFNNANSIKGYDLLRSLNKKNSINIDDYNHYTSAKAYIMGTINALKYSKDIYENIILSSNERKNKNKKMGNYFMPFEKEWDQSQYIGLVHYYLKKNPTKLYLSAVELISLSLFEASIMNSLRL